MAGRSYNRFRGGNQNRSPRWSGSDVRNISGRNYQMGSAHRQQQYRQTRMISPPDPDVEYSNYGRKNTVPRNEAYKSPLRVRDARPSRPQVQRAKRQPRRARGGSGMRNTRGGVFRKPVGRINESRRARQRKRVLRGVDYRRNSKRSRMSSSVNRWTNKHSGETESNRSSLEPSTLILASGVPGETDSHNFLDVKFLSHPFIRPFASINKETGLINIEVVCMTRHYPPDARERCEFSIMKNDIISIIVFEGNKIPDDIHKCKIDLELEQEKDVNSKMDQDDMEINPNGMASEELRLELKKRGLESHGLKGELILRLKSALAKESETMSKKDDLQLQDVDPSVLFIHVDSEEEENEDVSSSNGQRGNAAICDLVDQNSMDRSDQETNFVDEDEQVDEKSGQKGVFSKKFTTNEECYAFVSGIRGTVKKRALTETFSSFGKIVGVKQVARKCRIEFDSPAAVSMLVNRTTPVMFNGNALVITRDPAIVNGTQSKEKENSIEVACMDSDQFPENREDSEREQSLDEVVEVGRGSPERHKKNIEFNEQVCEDDRDVLEETKDVSKKGLSKAKKKMAVVDERMCIVNKIESSKTKGEDDTHTISKGTVSEKQFDLDDMDSESVDSDIECEDGKRIEVSDLQTDDESLLDFTDGAKESLCENDHQSPQCSDLSTAAVQGNKAEEKEEVGNAIGIEDFKNENKESDQKFSVESEQAITEGTELRESGSFESAVDGEAVEDSHYKDRVGLKNGLSLLEHLKLQAKRTKDRVSGEVKISKSTFDQSKKETCVEVITGEENKEEICNFTCKSYRVVIALRRGVKIRRRVETFVRREALEEARIVILEFALSPENMKPKEVFTAVVNGPLNEHAHGNVWPENGSLSFKSTVTKILKQMHVARSKEKRLSTFDALTEENKSLKDKGEELGAEVQKLEDEIVTLKKKIKKAKGFLG